MGLLDNIDEEESLSNKLDDDEYVEPDYEHRVVGSSHQRITEDNKFNIMAKFKK